MKRNSEMLGVALIVLAFSTLVLFDIFVVDPDFWFDEAFSLKSVYNLESGLIASWGEYDVHSGAYYRFLQGWMVLNPGLVDHQWARLLSFVAMFVFVIFVWRIVRFLSDDARVSWAVASIIGVSATYVHFGREARAYALCLMLSAVLLYAVMRGVERPTRLRAGLMILCSALLPVLHYWYAMVPLFILVAMMFVVEKKDRVVLAFLPIVMGLVSGLTAVVPIALEQLSRSDGMWFQPPSLASFPSALMFSFVFVEEAFSSVWMLIPFLLFLGMFVFACWKAWGMVASGSIKERWLAWMLLGSLLPFLGLLLPKLLLSGGFQNVYHHRLFLGVTWMFAVAVLTVVFTSFRGVRQKLVYVVVLVLAVSMTGVYLSNQHHEVSRLLMATGILCEDDARIHVGGVGYPVVFVHESPFSAIPFEVYKKENGCGWTDVVSTNLTERQGRTAGFDGLLPEQIYYDLRTPERPWIYVRAARTVTEDGFVIYQDDGVELVYVG